MTATVRSRRTSQGWHAHNERMRDQAVERIDEPWSLDRRHRCFRVPSRTVDGRTYEVRVEGAGGFALVSCNCPAGSGQAPLGSTPCHHGAVGCLAMEAAGLLVWSADATGGCWLMTEAACGRVVAPPAYKPVVRNPCAACGLEVDPDCLVPVEQQEVRRGDDRFHRKCAS